MINYSSPIFGSSIYKILIIALIPLFVAGCKKEDNPPTDEISQLYVSFTANDSIYHFNDNEDGFEDGVYFYESPPIDRFGYGASIYNKEFRLNNIAQTPINNFTLMFHDIVSDSIEIGEYKFRENVAYGTIEQGVEIYWMTKANWNNLTGYLKSTPNYLDDQHYRSNELVKNGENVMYSANDFFSSRYVNQPESKVTITRIQRKVYEAYTSPTTIGEFNDYIITGNFNCFTLSPLDSANVIQLSGEFKLHLPTSERYGEYSK